MRPLGVQLQRPPMTTREGEEEKGNNATLEAYDKVSRDMCTPTSYLQLDVSG